MLWQLRFCSFFLLGAPTPDTHAADNLIQNNIYYNVNIGDVPTPGRPQILMKGVCDSAIRASTHFRDQNSCPHPDSAPKTGCCCYPGCDQGKCSSFTFSTNIVFVNGSSTFVAKSAPGPGLNNMTFDDNV